VRVAVAAMLLAVLASPLSPSAFAADGRGLPASASTPASASDSAASTSSANASSANAASTKESSTVASASPTARALVAVALPDAPPMSGTDAAPAAEIKFAPVAFAPTTTEIAPAANELRTAGPSSTGTLSFAPAATNPALDSSFVTNRGLANNGLVNNALATIHALAAPPTAFIKLKQPPRTHSFFDARNTLGFATLGASLTADALSTQKGLAYPGFSEMNPIARPFVQSRTGAAVYNAGSFGLMAGLMYWAHKTEHHKLERILPFAIGSWEGLLSARNYHVIANRPR
jgi:hypothetical protein